MKSLRILGLITLASPVAAQQPTGDRPPIPASEARPPVERSAPIVVTGVRPGDSRRALDQCIARNCPPNEDIDASIAHAETLFVAGDYKGARRILNASVARNRRHAATHPVPVSDLYRVDYRVAAHLGEKKEYSWSARATKRALAAGLPDHDPRLVGADLEIADMQTAINDYRGARRTYRHAERKAREIGRADLAAMAGIRLAWLKHLEGDSAAARKALGEIVAQRDPAATVSRLAALVLLARFDRNEGRLDTSSALIEELRAAGLRKPALLYAPPIVLGDPRQRLAEEVPGDDYRDRWVDVGFWVGADGLVADIELLRESGSSRWMAPVLKSIAGRIYSPVSAEIGGSYRIERYTYTAWWERDPRTLTRIRHREPNPRIEFLDLTAEPDAADRRSAAPPPATGGSD